MDKLFSLTVKRTLGGVTHVSTNQAVAALTFDDGPNPVFTPVILDVLKKHNAKATFFMVGKNAERYPDMVRRVAQGGHAIGNHSWSHPSFPNIPRSIMRRELRACAQAVAPFGQKLFRPPFGRQNMSSRVSLFLLGYRAINWNMDVLDWKSDSSEQIAEKLAKDIRPGSIILLHDALFMSSEDRFMDRSSMVEALDGFLAQTGKGYRFVTIPELLRCGSLRRQNWSWRTRNTLKEGPSDHRLANSAQK